MELTFGRTFDEGAWPGPLAQRDAVIGARWVGPLGLLDVVETQLGLAVPPVPDPVRAARLLPALEASPGFWSASLDADPFGSARALLRLRDELVTCGWNGGGSARLDTLARALADVAPGVPDRVRASTRALDDTAIDVRRVALRGEERVGLPPIWRGLLDALERCGTTVVEEPLPTDGDGDGNGRPLVRLNRPAGPITAAEDVAAWIADHASNGATTVVIGADPGLDAALRAFGLPTLGSTDRASATALLSVLPLALRVGRRPCDPDAARRLLLLPIGPVPRSVAVRLLRALGQLPAVDSDAWRTALQDGLATLETAERRHAVARRLTALFASDEPARTGAGIAAAAAIDRATLIGDWARRRGAVTDDGSSWTAIQTQCATFVELIRASRVTNLTDPRVDEVVRLATRTASPPPSFRAETRRIAPVSSITRPGSLADVADHVIWWNFTRSAAERVPTLALTPDEREALDGLGAALPDPGAEASRLGAAWRRPFRLARATLLLVSPTVDARGETATPHPVWDEEHDRHPDAGAPLDRARDRMLVAIPSPAPRTTWHVPFPLRLEEHESISPTSGERLLGAPIDYAVERIGKVRSGLSASLPTGNRLKGIVAHRIIEEIIQARRRGEISDPDTAERSAGDLFLAEGPRLATEYFLPGRDVERDELRDVIASSTRELVRLLDHERAHLEGTEVELAATIDGVPMRGFADIVLREPRVVIDLKWSSEGWHRQSLQDGTAIQLATYAGLLDAGAADSTAVYFVLTARSALVTGGRFGEARRLAGPSLRETLAAFVASVRAELAAFEHGDIASPADPETRVERTAFVDGRIVVPPSRFSEVKHLFWAIPS